MGQNTKAEHNFHMFFCETKNCQPSCSIHSIIILCFVFVVCQNTEGFFPCTEYKSFYLAYYYKVVPYLQTQNGFHQTVAAISLPPCLMFHSWSSITDLGLIAHEVSHSEV